MNTKKKVRPAATRPEDQKLSLGSTFAYGFQHVLTMYGGIIAPPLIITKEEIDWAVERLERVLTGV